ncbi:MAG: 3-beta hydroxysteroid dehydrogenase [Candidatus Scalindua sp.]|nr:MAG: 3-beta hydroxysteroid dehydrogenase [Candidatus Scalindua sp.]
MEKRGKIILVTGSTGFLGNAITRRLLASGYKLRLLIRKRDNQTPLQSFGREAFIKDRVLGNWFDEYLQEQQFMGADHAFVKETLYDRFLRNIEIIEGDLPSSGLGLEVKVYSKLAREVDEVFHCAAVTHFETQGTDEHMAVNVKGTENVLRFANCEKPKRFHYISTAYVAGRQDGMICEHEMVHEPLFNNEYERSKFIAEQVVIKYAKTNDIPFTIYRPGIIVGDSRSGATGKFNNLYLFAKILFTMKNFFTHHENEDGDDVTIRVPGDPDAAINLVPIDYVADAIVAILKSKESVDKIFHITNPNPPKLSELRDLLMPLLEIKGIDLKIERVLEQKKLNTMEKLLLRQTRSYNSYLYSKLRFDGSNTRKVLTGTGIVCPAMTKELVKVLMDFAISHNWGEENREVLQRA